MPDNISTIEKKEEQTPVISAPLNSLSLVEKAEAAAKRIEEANKRTEELLKRNEEAVAMLILGGKAEAGKVPEKPAEITPKDYAQKVMKGETNPFSEA